MFNVGSGEFLVILLLALVVLGPTRLPDALRQLGRFLGEARKLSANFQNEVNEAMKDPVKVVTGEDTPKLPKLPRNAREMVGFAVPEPFAAMEKTETDEEKQEKADEAGQVDTVDTAEGATADAAETADAEVSAEDAVVSAEPAVATTVEPAALPPRVGGIDSAAAADALSADAPATASGVGDTSRGTDEDDEVPMFGDR